MTRPTRGLIVLGIDGSGKTTQAGMTVQRLAAEHAEVALYTRSAGIGPSDPPSVRTAAAVDTAARMRASMESAGGGFWVADRFSYCHYAVDRLSREPAEHTLRAAFADLPVPETVVWLEVPPDEAQRRITLRGEDTETLAYLTALRDAYWSLPESAGFTVLDGTGSVEDVHSAILAVIGR